MSLPRLCPCAAWVYGWGDAPDTQYLLRTVETRVRPGLRVADLGGGTGIVGIAAALRGARVVVYETRPRWRELIQQNADANGVQVAVRGTFPETWDGVRYDLLLVNIGRHTLELSPYAIEVIDAQTT